VWRICRNHESRGRQRVDPRDILRVHDHGDLAGAGGFDGANAVDRCRGIAGQLSAEGLGDLAE
jgi:hypothetical protein